MKTINDPDFKRIVSFVREKYGINLEHKRTLVDARLSFEIKKRGYSDFTSYFDNTISNPNGDECHHMINKLSTNYTFFFREADYINQLSNTALSDLISRKKNKIKIWCAACSSGEEPYSVAMVLEQYRSHINNFFDFEIVATDINTDMLLTAEKGIYSGDELFRIPIQYRYLVHCSTDNTFTISDKIKSKISWQYKNLMNFNPSAELFDIIFCRNVMIYFTPELRREMTGKLYSSLLPNGYLYTGTTESIDLERKYFCYLAPAFYRADTKPKQGE